MTETTSDRLEIKATTSPAASGDTQAMFAEFMTAFEEFKRTNDGRLAELERRGSADVLTGDKLERLNAVLDGAKAALDRQALERARPQLEGGRQEAGNEYKDAFAAYVKRGETKALTIGTPSGGGYLVPAETETEINRLLVQVSPIRAIAGNRQVSTGTYKKPVTITGPAVGWADETTARSSATTSQTLDSLDFPTAELYAMPAATAVFLEDAVVDVDAWIAEEVNAAFAAQETNAFVLGTGTNKPKGFLDETKVANGSWAWDSIGYVATGEAGALPDEDESDVLIDLVYALKAQYRQNATWVMNRKTQGLIRKLKDAEGNYLWQPALAPDSKASLMGFPLVEVEDMPDVASNSFSVAFGDFRRGYLVVDRQGVNVLRDPFSAKPFVLFYTTKRVGGGVQDFDAIKLLKFGTS
jgi:HK97 family phage major capsid protein